jgi:antitoxin component YwqK of YwqJK toxin-antitoxin module
MKHLFLALHILICISCNTGNNTAPVTLKDKKDNATSAVIQQQDSLKDGIFRTFHPNGALKMEGMMKDGKRTGNWKAYYEDGTLWSEGFFHAGLRDGGTWVYHSNGIIKIKGTYEKGKKVGKWLFYNEKGEIVDSTRFR